MDEIKNLDELFDYSHSEYNFINGDDYAKYLKDNYYQDSNRTALGLYIELQTHYAAYLIGNEHATNGAQMAEAGLETDKSALACELAAMYVTLFFIIIP